MSNTDDDALSIVDSYQRARTNGDIDHALTRVSDGVRCFAPVQDVTTETDWPGYLSRFVPMLTAFDPLSYAPRQEQPA